MNLKKIFNKILNARSKSEFKRHAVYGNGFGVARTAHCISHTRANIKIGNHCEAKGTLYSYKEGKILIGDNCYIGVSSFIGAKDQIKIGNEVIIASHVRIFDNNNHPTDPDLRKKMSQSDFYCDLWTWDYADSKPVYIEDNVWIGEYSKILKGVKIGKGSIVASNSVVTKDVPEYVIVAGNPAKVVKKLR